MKLRVLALLAAFLLVPAHFFGEATNIAEDDASQTAYSSGWIGDTNGGSGFGKWTFTSEGNDDNRHSGFFVAGTTSNQDLNGIARSDKAFGLYANGSGFEQAVAYRSIDKALAIGDSFSFLMENGTFEKKFEKDDPAAGSIGLVLRTGNAHSSPGDYNSGAMFEFSYYEGKANFQIYDGSNQTDSGVGFVDSGVSVTITLTATDTYDLEIQTLKDKKLTKLPGRKFSASGLIESFAVFDRNGEKNDAYFNGFQISR